MARTDLKKIRARIDDAKKRRDELAGGLKQVLTDIEKEFDAKDLKSARKKLTGIRATKERLTEKFDEAMAKLEEEFGDL